jgi:hypothetical protein
MIFSLAAIAVGGVIGLHSTAVGSELINTMLSAFTAFAGNVPARP